MAEMDPADVPEDYVRACDDATAHCWGHPDHGIRLPDCCRRAGLAAVLPLHENEVRRAIAAELWKLTIDCPQHGNRPSTYAPGCVSCNRRAALIGARRIILREDGPNGRHGGVYASELFADDAERRPTDA